MEGVNGTANSSQGLEVYFLTAAELGKNIKEFCEYFEINADQRGKIEEKYQFSGSKKASIGENVDKLLSFFATYNVIFNLPDSVCNILTMEILSQKEAVRFLNAAIISQDSYK